jgi:hypothetical protein
MRKLLSILIVGVVITSCSSLKITYNMDTTIDFSKYKTYSYYGWDTASTHINKFYQNKIEYAFADELGKRGLTYDPMGEGDIVISLFLVLDAEKSVQAYNNYYNNGPYGYPTWGWGYGYGAPYTYGNVTYEEHNYYYGTLVCDMFDRRTKKLAWQGVVSKAVEPSEQGRYIGKTISRLMMKFPIKEIKE